SVLGEKLAPNYTLYKQNSIRKFNRNGLTLETDISDYIGHFTYFGFEDKASEKLFELTKGKEVIFDVGANIGFTSLNLSQSSNNLATKVYAFEPDPYNYSKLIDNLNLNVNHAVSAENIGIGDTVENLKLVINTANNLGGNRINKNATENYSIIPVTTVDIFVEERKISTVDLIKIDIEGFEMNALKGAEQTIKSYKPILFVEVNNENLKIQNSSAQELIAYLEKYYSVIYNAENDMPVNSNDNFDNCHIDIIAKN
ncbi:MAG: FkbM family methyltransferase, partial [Crocinitomicaceae bacterium]